MSRGIIGGAASSVQGGKFSHGFVSAGASELFGGNVGSRTGNLITSAIVGGTVSHFVGGKFANGAVTAAFAWVLRGEAEAPEQSNGAITGSQGRGTQEESVEAPLSSGLIGRVAADGYGPPAPFSTLDEAAIAGIEEAVSLSTRYEYGGAIVEVDGGYYATAPVTIGSRHHFAFSLEAGVSPVAIYHTHPGGSDYGIYFSAGDIYTARDHLGVPSYIGVLGNRSVRVFDPNTMRATFRGRGLRQTSTTRGYEVCARCF